MSQHDLVLADAPGATFRADLNLALLAQASNQSGTAEPSPTYAYRFWADTTTGYLKQRNAANNAWITLGSLADLGIQSGIQTYAGGGGTADAITATFAPVLAASIAGIPNGALVRVRATAANTTTTPTFAPNGLTAKTIVKGAGAALVAGDIAGVGHGLLLRWDQALDKWELLNPASGLVGVGSKIQPITASVSSNALTITLNPTSLDFRSATLGSGTVNTRAVGSAISVVVSSGSTLGTVSAQQSRLAVLAIDNAGTVELAVVNIAGGNNLTETGVISTTAEGGAGAADSASTIYSTTARSNVPYRVVGFVESTQATAGTWATAPSTIQGAGGNALNDMSSLGYGQTWQSLTGSRAFSTTYYNTTGKPIAVSIGVSASISAATLTIGTTASYAQPGTSTVSVLFGIVPPGGSYSCTYAGSLTQWSELR